MTADLLTDEDRIRSSDRARVAAARIHGRRWQLFWLLIGPGILVMLGENDGPSMISYMTAGAVYGVGFFLPFIAVTFAMAVVCQEMSMRVGAVTHRGYGQLVMERFGPLWGWCAAGDLIFTNLVTLVAEFAAIRIGFGYFHLGALAAAGFGLTLVTLTLTARRYRRWELVVLGMAMFNGLFLVAAIMARPHWGTVARGLVTFSPLPSVGLHTFLLLVASTIGATVTPWMIFFQQSASADKGLTRCDVRHGRYDTATGAVLAALFGCAAFLIGATVAGHAGHPAAKQLGATLPAAIDHRAGGIAATIVALGLIECGAVAILTISASTGYAIGECLGAAHSFNSSLRRAAAFYGGNVAAALIAAAVVVIPGVPLVRVALNVNVLATVLLPVTLVFLILLANDRELMGDAVNRRAMNHLAVAIAVFVSLAGGAYGVESFLASVHALS